MPIRSIQKAIFLLWILMQHLIIKKLDGKIRIRDLFNNRIPLNFILQVDHLIISDNIRELVTSLDKAISILNEISQCLNTAIMLELHHS
jgi:hypothetical protein